MECNGPPKVVQNIDKSVQELDDDAVLATYIAIDRTDCVISVTVNQAPSAKNETRAFTDLPAAAKEHYLGNGRALANTNTGSCGSPMTETVVNWNKDNYAGKGVEIAFLYPDGIYVEHSAGVSVPCIGGYKVSFWRSYYGTASLQATVTGCGTKDPVTTLCTTSDRQVYFMSK